MATSNKKHKKILVLFFFGIGLPSLLLGYFAYRGIQNDQALLEKERREEHYRLAELITTSIDAHILKSEQAFRSAITAQPDIPQPSLIRSLDSLKNQNSLVQDIFYMHNKNVRLPTAVLLFQPNSSSPAISSSVQIDLMQDIKTAQQFEFQQLNYRNALTHYERAFARVSDRAVKGELLVAMARVQKKSKHFPDAINSYQTIAEEYSQTRMADGAPLGLAARLELGSLFLIVHDSSRAITTFVELYKDLIQGQWLLQRAQYDFFAQRVKASIKKMLSPRFLSYRNTFKRLQEQEQQKRQFTENCLTFQTNAFQRLQEYRAALLSDAEPIRLVLDIGGFTYFISVLGKNDKKSEGIWGLLFNSDQLKNHLLHIVQCNVSSDNTGWIIRDQDGQVIFNSENRSLGSNTVKVRFIDNFPPWFIEFYQPESHLFETFLTSRRGIYFFMFLLIAGILLFGLTFTIRAVSHELELAKLKSDFVSTISHEFKSPLTSIRQMAEMLKRDRVPSEERRHRYYDVLVEQSQRLSLLIDNILDFTKMEEGKKEFEFEKTDIKQLLQEIVSTVQDRVRYEKFVIQTRFQDQLPAIYLDHAAITQAIDNLIDNAIKYSGDAKKVIVHAFTKNQHVVIAVQDYGVGIAREDIHKIFERFFRGGDELTRTVKGSGLGLSLVKQIVDAHHGSVEVTSEPGCGSTFSIRLPIQSAQNEFESGN